MDFSSIQPVAGQPIQVGNQNFYPFMCSSGRFLAATTRAGLLETMEPVMLACGRLNAKRLVSFGLAGALSDRYAIGDVVVVRSIGRHDRGGWTNSDGFAPKSTALGNVKSDPFLDKLTGRFIALCRAKGLSVHEDGRLVAGDAFIASDDYRAHLASTFGVDLVDMNSAAFTAAMESFNRPGLVVRVVSDKADSNASVDFPAFVQDRSKALQRAAQALAEALREVDLE